MRFIRLHVNVGLNFVEADIDRKDGKTTNASLYQDLAAVTETKHIYEAIKKPSEAIHISVQGDARNDSSHT